MQPSVQQDNLKVAAKIAEICIIRRHFWLLLAVTEP